ncbi:MAG: amidase family protein, partial [Pseudomonadota bacterium]
PLLAAAKLLYAGPWVAERYVAITDFIDEKPEQVHPVVRGIIAAGKDKTAAQTFKAEYRMQEYRKAAQTLLQDVDFLLTPTAPGVWTVNEVLNDPVTLNSRMGYYTNYMNLLDLSGIAVPAGFLNSGVGFGVTMIAPAFRDQMLLDYAYQWQVLRDEPVGKDIKVPLPTVNAVDPATHVQVAVCGAHLSGMPLNWQLAERGGSLVRAGKSSA